MSKLEIATNYLLTQNVKAHVKMHTQDLNLYNIYIYIYCIIYTRTWNLSELLLYVVCNIPRNDAGIFSSGNQGHTRSVHFEC